MSARSHEDPVRGLLERAVARARTPGAAWWIEGPDGRARQGCLGWAATKPDRVPLTQQTPFDLASLTKPLCTALLLVLLEQDGTVDPRSPVTDFLPEMREGPFADVSLLELAAHVSGLAAWRPLCARASDRAGYLACIAEELPVVARGVTLYSDLGYILLGVSLERATGRTLDALFDQRIAAPLGRPRIGYADRDYGDAAATECGSRYERRLAGAPTSSTCWRTEIPRGQVHDSNAHGLGGVAGHAGLFGSAEAVAAVAREILRPDRLALGDGARRRLLRPWSVVAGRTIGMVLASRSRAARGILPDDSPGHTGFTGTSLWFDPEHGYFFVLLTNRIHPEVAPVIFDVVRRGFHRLACGWARSSPRG